MRNTHLSLIIRHGLSKDPTTENLNTFKSCGSQSGKTNTVKLINPQGTYTARNLLAFVKAHGAGGTWVVAN